MEGVGVMSFWRGKRVFVTGHTGFKGSWLCLWLQSMGASVVGYALKPPTEPNLFTLADVQRDMISIEGDIRDREHLLDSIKKYKPEVILHFAAQALVRKSYKNPLETFETNVMGTVYLLDALRYIDGIKVVINVTSDKCYENKELTRGYREDDPLGGYDPYSSSKGCAELVTAAFRSSYFNPELYEKHGVAMATVRAGNVIGGGDWAEDRLIPDIMRAIFRKQPVYLRNPHTIRPWQHVLDPLNGYLLLAEKLWDNGNEFSGAWNFGPSDDDTRSVGELTQQLTEIWGKGAKWISDEGEHLHEANYLKLDCSKARQRLGWKTNLTLSETLHWVAEWYKAYAENKDIQTMTLNQIERYEQLSKEQI